ncbi:MAG TPA: phospholipase D-like domain-containing protein [Chthoniobacterales bacterium]
MSVWTGLFLSAITIAAALLASGHAIIYKRDPRSAALWVIVIWMLPAAGPVLYLLLGINRVRRRAAALRADMVRHRTVPDVTPFPSDLAFEGNPLLLDATHLIPVARLVSQIVERPLLPGNKIEPLVNGSQAYPSMLAAIESARESVCLASYIFSGDGIGTAFIEALAQAMQRGVAVRVLIDDMDARFSRSSALKRLRCNGVPVGVFNPALLPARLKVVHLRNHRKILVVDGAVGFTGGLNIDSRYWKPEDPKAAFSDLHFRLLGPVVAHLAEVFADDWQFTTGERLRGKKWFPPLPSHEGSALARGIEAGPDHTFDRVRWPFIGGLNAAQRSARVLTPYFVPDAGLISALNAAAMRGVEVDIFLPEQSDLPHLHWAAFAQLWQVLEHGCHVWISPGPFDHSKLMVVDGAWTLLGSANWDTRSLRLNFEFNVECYDTELGKQLETLAYAKRVAGRELTLAEVNARSLPIKLRDGLVRLFAPYL